MNEIGIGLIGAGFMGRTNAETVNKYLSGARLVAIAGGSRAPQLASEYNVDCAPSVRGSGQPRRYSGRVHQHSSQRALRKRNRGG